MGLIGRGAFFLAGVERLSYVLNVAGWLPKVNTSYQITF
jgi:hypothetical protein